MTGQGILAAGITIGGFKWTGDFTTIDLIAATTNALNGALLARRPDHYKNFTVVGILLVVTGAGFTIWTSNSNATLQLAAPDHMRGRVVGLYYYAFSGSGPLGGILAGWLAARGGTQLALLVGGVAGVAATALAAAGLREAASRPVRRLEPAPEQARAA